ncbi:LOW QUALITY PROTEIN: T cell receptor alpha variable 17, partial [Galemys pyrenaicus]
TESKDQVLQFSTVISPEGAVAEISCNHSISNVYNFFWYIHLPESAPRLLIKGTRPAQQGRYNMTYERFSSSLLITQVQVADAATYYCALEDTEAGDPEGDEQKLGEITTFCRRALVSLDQELAQQREGTGARKHLFPEGGPFLKHCCHRGDHALRAQPQVVGHISSCSGLRTQSVTQPEDQVTVNEGDPLTVNCTYSISGSPYLFWYVQYPSQGPKFLLKYIGGKNLVKGSDGFEAEFNKSHTSFHLRRHSVTGRDSAMYFCAGTDTVGKTAGGAEHKLHLAKTTQPGFIDSCEGQEVNITCEHTGIATDEYIFWYRQAPNQGPRFVIQGYKTNVVNEVASLLIPEDRKSSTLHLPPTTLSDSAVYYCIVRGTVTQTGLHLCRILHVQEGNNYTLMCKFSTTLQASETPKQQGRLSTSLNFKDQSNTLNIMDFQLEDSAAYLCVVEAQCSGVICSLFPRLQPQPQPMEQNPPSLSIQEGEEAVMTCNYNNLSPAYLHWYRQDLGRDLFFLVLIRENEGEKQAGKLRVTFETANKKSTLRIAASQPSDSATYFCAADAQRGPATSFLHTNSANPSWPTELQAQAPSLSPRDISDCEMHLPNHLLSFLPFLVCVVSRSSTPPEELYRKPGAECHFQATHDQNNKNFYLKKPSMQVSDLAVYFCAVDTHVQLVTQLDSHISVSVGASLELRCNCSYVGSSGLSSTPTKDFNFSLKDFNDFEAEFKKNESSFNLRKRFARWRDSAEYFCVLNGTDSLTVNCSYSASGYPALFWYVHYPGESPQILLKVMTAGNKGTNKGFEATYRKDPNSFHLEKTSVQESDSAVYYCALRDTVTEAAGGAEHKLSTEGVWPLSVCIISTLLRTKSWSAPGITHSTVQALLLALNGNISYRKICPAFTDETLILQEMPGPMTQLDTHVLVSEGNSLELRCNYSYGATPYRFWYVQYPNQGLQLLLKSFSQDTLVQGIKDFKAKFEKTNSSFNLKKSSAHWSDSAQYFCAVRVRGMQVDQTPPSLSLQEGNSCTLRCNFSTTVTYVQWFRQNPGGSLVTLLYTASATLKHDGRFSTSLNFKDQSSTLNITDSQLEDSATYLCAGRHKHLGDTLEMNSSPGLVAVVFLLLRQTHGDSVTQLEGQMILSSGDALNVTCTFSTTQYQYPTLFWYVQYPGESLQLLLRAQTVNKKETNKGFEATYRKTPIPSTWRKPQCKRCRIAQTVTQTQWAMSVQEKETVTLNSLMTLFTLEQAVQLLGHEFPYSPGFLAPAQCHRSLLTKASNSISHIISASQWADSAVYFCELRELRVRVILGQNQEHLGDTLEMNSSPGLVTVVLLLLGQTHGDSVTQQEGQVTLSVGESLTVNCEYSAKGYPVLFWYVQYPGESLQLLLRAQTVNKKETNKGFEATYRKDPNSFHLEKTSVQESDSAVYYCAQIDTVTETAGGAEHKLSSRRSLAAALMSKMRQSLLFSPGQTHGDSVTQLEGQMILSSGDALNVTCTFLTTGYPTLFWYVQYPGEGLQLLLKAQTANSKGTGKGFEATYRKDPNSFHLEKTSVQESDSAVYYCAQSDTVTEAAGGAEHKLSSRNWLLCASAYLIHCGLRGAQVQQSPSSLSLQEGNNCSLMCTFSTALQSVQWFRQNPGGGLVTLFYTASATPKHNGRLSTSLSTKNKSSTLNITGAQPEDSATYLCGMQAQCSGPVRKLQLGFSPSSSYELVILPHWLSQGEKVEQQPSSLSIQEGHSAVIDCAYSDSASSYFSWYKQEPGQGPQLIIYIRSPKSENLGPRHTVLLDTEAKKLTLIITVTQPEDSAVYFECTVLPLHLQPVLKPALAAPPLAQPSLQYSLCADMTFLICHNCQNQHNATEVSSLDFQKTSNSIILVISASPWEDSANQEHLGDTLEMNSSSGLVAVVLLLLRQTNGDSVTQLEGQLTFSAGDSLTVNCTYSASGYLTLFWYVQYPGEGLQLLLKAQTANSKGTGKGFEATYRKDPNSFHLEKTSVQESDSAVYYCALRDTVTEAAGGAEHKLSSRRGLAAIKCLFFSLHAAVRGMQVDQNPPSLSLQEGSNYSLSCKFSARVTRVQWFRQNPGGSLVTLFYTTSATPKHDGRFSTSLNFKDQFSTLNITDSQLEDSATYLCAGEAQCSGRKSWGLSQGEKVEQQPSSLSIQEGHSAVIDCAYSDSASSYFSWYKQEPGQGPQLIIYIRSPKSENLGPRHTVLLDTEAKKLTLIITVTQPEDSAVECTVLPLHLQPVLKPALAAPPLAQPSLQYSLCAVRCRISRMVTQTQWAMSVQEKETVTLNSPMTPVLILKTSTMPQKTPHWVSRRPAIPLTLSSQFDKMNSSPGLVAVVLLLLGQTNGDSVTQLEGQLTFSAGDSLTVNCTYSTTRYPTLFWYVQYPGEGLQVLLRAETANSKGTGKGFEATYQRDPNKTFHLEKTSVQESDSAVYYCALRDTVTEAAGGAEHKLSSRRSLGRGANRRKWSRARVAFSDYASQYFFWYRQYPGKVPKVAVYISVTEGKDDGKFAVLLDQANQNVFLLIRDAQPSDSASYLCAPEGHVSVLVGDPVQLKCNYMYSGSPYLFWYVQYPKQAPQLLLNDLKGKIIKGFSVNLDKGKTSFHLKKERMKKLLGVSLVILWLLLARVSNQQEEQNLQTLSFQEGENATVNCSYKGTLTNLQWYRQDSGRGLTHLILIRSNEKIKDGERLQVTLDTSTKSSSLVIMASRPADSAAYFCAKPPPWAGLVVMSSREGTSIAPGSRKGRSSQICKFCRTMLSASCSGLIILLLLRRTSGDSVNQTAGPVTLPEGARLILNCTYQTSYSAYLFWYVQRPNKGLEFLLKSTSENSKDSKGFWASNNSTDRSFHLKKPSVQMSDSAVYFCALRDTVREVVGGAEHKPRGSSMTQTVTQAQSAVSVVEEEATTLSCNYNAKSRTYYLFWYKQPPDGKMIFLIHQESFNVQGATKDRYSLTFQEAATGGLSSVFLRSERLHSDIGLSGEDQVNQSPQSLTLEGTNVSLNCNYNVRSFRSLQWYKQHPGRGPEFLFILYSVGKNEHRENLNAMLSKDESSLRITAPKPEDSATYLCAVDAQCSQGTCSLYPNLQLWS